MAIARNKRPDLKQLVLSTLCMDRAVPLWGKPEDGNVSDKTLNATLLGEIAHILARHGVQRGASISIADAALVTQENLAALGDILCVTRLPATSSACERVIAEAVSHTRWEEVGILAHTKPTKHRPATSYKVDESAVDPLWHVLSGRGGALQPMFKGSRQEPTILLKSPIIHLYSTSRI